MDMPPEHFEDDQEPVEFIDDTRPKTLPTNGVEFRECKSIYHVGDRKLPLDSDHFGLKQKRRYKNGQRKWVFESVCKKCEAKKGRHIAARKSERIQKRIDQLVALHIKGKLPKSLVPHTAEVAEALNRAFHGPDVLARYIKVTHDGALEAGDWSLAARIQMFAAKYLHDVSEAGHSDKPDHLKTADDAMQEMLANKTALQKYLGKYGYQIVPIEEDESPKTIAADKRHHDIEHSHHLVAPEHAERTVLEELDLDSDVLIHED